MIEWMEVEAVDDMKKMKLFTLLCTEGTERKLGR